MSHAADDPLHHLLDALADLRRFWERPERKRKFIAELGEPVELGVLRTLRAVERFDIDADAETSEPSVGSVAQALAVDASTASRLVDQAVRARYLDRLPGRLDRRRSRLALTDAGQELLDRAAEIRRRWLTRITGDWTPAEVETLASLLRRFIDDATVFEDSAHEEAAR